MARSTPNSTAIGIPVGTTGIRGASVRPAVPRRRRVASQRQPFDRRELERRGWRTTLEYRENHRRDELGVLAGVVAEWNAEGERMGPDGFVEALSACGASPAAAWRRLRIAAESAPSVSSDQRRRRVASR